MHELTARGKNLGEVAMIIFLSRLALRLISHLANLNIFALLRRKLLFAHETRLASDSDGQMRDLEVLCRNLQRLIHPRALGNPLEFGHRLDGLVVHKCPEARALLRRGTRALHNGPQLKSSLLLGGKRLRLLILQGFLHLLCELLEYDCFL